jgi:RNA polymerase sigma-70 factor, ECF subfamily
MRGPTARRVVGWRPSTAPHALFERVDRMPSEPPGVPRTFAQLATLYEAMLQRIALRLTGNPETARDLVQDTLLRALRYFDQLQPGTNPAAWLTTILTNLFYDHLKHQKVELKAVPELATLEQVTCDTPLGTIPDSELYAAVQALDPELREVVELCYLHQMRYREAAERLGVPVGTIGTRLLRARARLRELLTPSSQKS